jgi:HNH endonuclease
MRIPRELTPGVARDLLRYEPGTGSLRWKRHSRNYKPGEEVGGSISNGYRQVQILGKSYRFHRVAWVLMTGEWPGQQVDHVNRDRLDNRWCNLRLATPQQNAANSLKPSQQGMPKGVRPQANGRTFQAKIMRNGRYMCLGTYPTPEIAHEAYVAAAERLHGEFARGS